MGGGRGGEVVSGMFIRHLCSGRLEWPVVILLTLLSTSEFDDDLIDLVETFGFMLRRV